MIDDMRRGFRTCPPGALPCGLQLDPPIDNCQFTFYKPYMIVGFRHKGLKRFYETDDRSKLPAALVERIAIILADLDAAGRPEDMDRPNFHLHPLKGAMKGFFAVTVRANWRIVFRFEDGHVRDVDFLDYH